MLYWEFDTVVHINQGSLGTAVMPLSLVQVKDSKEACCIVRINWDNWIASLWVCFELNFEGNLQSKILLRFGLLTSPLALTYNTPSLKVPAFIKPDSIPCVVIFRRRNLTKNNHSTVLCVCLCDRPYTVRYSYVGFKSVWVEWTLNKTCFELLTLDSSSIFTNFRLIIVLVN